MTQRSVSLSLPNIHLAKFIKQSSTMPYQYEPLPPAKKSWFRRTRYFTRVLRVSPGSGDDPLRGTMDIIDITSEESPYEALSYAWGTEAASKTFYLDGCQVPIRPNLNDALIWLRHPKEVRSIWIDAICINQDDVDERTRQVGYMRRVYEHASRVIVWVGLRTAGVEDAFRLAQTLGASSFENLQPASDKNEEGGDRSESLRKDLNNNLPHLVALAQRPYFVRTWGIQEVVVAKDVVLKCEDLEINFDHLLGSWNHISADVEDVLGPNNSIFSMWMAMLATRKATAGTLKPLVPKTIGPLSLTLDLSRPYLSTDPRDKIFSVLGICWEGVRPGYQQFFAMDYIVNWGVVQPLKLILFVTIKIAMLLYSPSRLQMPKELQPDYQKTTAELYTTFARFLIEHQAGQLGILNNVSHIEDPEDGEYPSWVPKWFEPKKEINMAEDFKMGYYRAFWSMATTRGASFSKESEQPHILSLDGYTFDVVGEVADVFRFRSEEFDDTFGGIVGAWYELFDFSFVPRSGETYYDGQPLDVAFLKAISAWPKGDVALDITKQQGTVGFNYRVLNGYFNMNDRAEDRKGFNAEIYMWHMAIIIREAQIREECGIASDQDEDEDEMRQNAESRTSSFTAGEITQAGHTSILDSSAPGHSSNVVSDTDGNTMDSIGPAKESPSAEQKSHPFLQLSGLEKARAMEVEPYTFAYEDINWDDLENLSEAYPEGLYQTAHNRRAFTTSDGFIGLGPSRMKPGDQVVVLFGSELPSILRPRPQGGFYLIGQAYILHEELRSGSLTQSVASGNGAFSRNTYDIY